MLFLEIIVLQFNSNCKELIICLKMDLVLNNLQGWYAIKPKKLRIYAKLNCLK